VFSSDIGDHLGEKIHFLHCSQQPPIAQDSFIMQINSMFASTSDGVNMNTLR